jgi:hypothetical protein
VTTLLLTVTGIHWAEFRTTLSTPLVLWVGSYVFDPIAITLLVVTHRLGSASQPGAHRRSGLFVAEAAVLGMLGWFMLALPEAAAAVCPWRIPPLLAQLYSQYFRINSFSMPRLRARAARRRNTGISSDITPGTRPSPSTKTMARW